MSLSSYEAYYASSYTLNLTAALTVNGAANKGTLRALAASLTATGAAFKQAILVLVATLALTVSNYTRRTLHGLSAVLAGTGSFAKDTVMGWLANLTFATANARKTLRSYTATLTASTAISRMTERVYTAVQNLAGAFGKRGQKAFQGIATFAGALVRALNLVLSAQLSPTAALKRTAQLPFVASQSVSGAVTRAVRRVLAASALPVGALASSRTYFQVLIASLGNSGQFLKRGGKVAVAALTPSGSIGRLPHKALTAVSSLGGTSPAVMVSHALNAAFTATGSVTRRIARDFVANLNTVGIFVKTLLRSWVAALTSTSAFEHFKGSVYNGVLAVAGAITGKLVMRNLSANLTSSGFMATVGLYRRVLTEATLTLTGSTSRAISHVLSSVQSVTGQVARSLSRALTGLATMTGLFTIPSDTVALMTARGSLNITATLKITVPDKVFNPAGTDFSRWIVLYPDGVLVNLEDRQYRLVEPSLQTYEPDPDPMRLK